MLNPAAATPLINASEAGGPQVPSPLGGSGVPMGSLFLMAPVFAAVGLPVEGIGILIALDLLPDIFKTISAVTGDMAVAAILSKPDEMTKSGVGKGESN